MSNTDAIAQSEQSQPQEYVYQLVKWKTTLFAARYSGLYRSDDSGQTWQTAYRTLNLPEPLPTMAVAVSPTFDRDPRVFVGVNGGMLRSLDGGENWESAVLPPPPPIVSAVVLSPNFEKDGIVFAATMEDGVLFSSDRGSRFNAWNFGLLDLNILSLVVSPDFAEDETVFAGAQTSVFRSTNGGRAWREVDLPAGYDAILSLALSPDFAHDGTLLAGTETQGLWLSSDGGETWHRLGEEILTEAINAIYLSPDFSARPEILALHGGTLVHSTDCGDTWTPWREEILADKDVTTVLAPEGFGPDTSVFVGLVNGEILCLD